MLHTAAMLRTSQSHRTAPCPRDSCPSVPFAGVVEKSPRLGCPPRAKNASHLLTGRAGEQQDEEQKYRKNWEERERTHVGTLHHRVPGSPWSGMGVA